MPPKTASTKPPVPSPLLTYPIKSHADAMQSTIVKPPEVVEGLLLKQTATLVSALPHGMKSLSWLAACLQAPTTHRVWGHFDASKVSRTLFIETEDPEWMVEARIRGLTRGLPLEARNGEGFQYWCPGPFDLVSQTEELKKRIRDSGADFVVLSTLQNLLHGRNMNKQDEMASVMEAILSITREVCPLSVITHSPWNERSRRAYGAVTQTANFLTTLHYRKMMNTRTKETFAHVLLDSKAGGEDSSFHLKLTTEGNPKDPASVRSILYGGEGWPKGIGKENVLAILEEDPGLSAEEVAERSGVSKRYVNKLISDGNGKKRKTDAQQMKPLDFLAAGKGGKPS